jgi:hypothetical protein
VIQQYFVHHQYQQKFYQNKILLSSFTGICNPLKAIAQISPTVFKVTVFPPVFGPVMISEENFSLKKYY